MAQDSPDNTAVPRKEGQKVWLWSRSANGHVGEGAPGSESSSPSSPDQTNGPNPPKLNPTEFQSNFPPQEGAAAPGFPSITEAVKTIKSDDFLSVTQTPCARNGFLTGIASGAGIGGLRYVMRGRCM